MPHAMRWLCPTMMPGAPGSATPATFMPGASRCVMYQMPGSEYSRCMSLDSSALPDAVWLPAMAQALDPGLASPNPRIAYRKFTLARSPCAIRLFLTISSFHVVVRLRYMCRHSSRQSTALHGRGW